ncbi:TadE/TadG family type IV pilus assembly protein [Marivita sp. S2033]|uniref:TadE/TadG family type IV pilus assembly protein n=1 Tax=Marivita sp. S2033 TaxID=3373187 RepID=UPI003981FC20
MKDLPNNFWRFYKDQSGAVAIEFVLIGPLLFTLLLGIITVGYFMGVSHSVLQLASGAARASVAGLDQAERATLVNTYLSEAHTRYPLLTTDGLVPTVTFEGSDPAGITVEVSYSVDGTLLDVTNSFLKLGIETIHGRAYLAY